MLGTFVIAWLITQAGSLLMLEIGARFAHNRLLLRLGQIAHRKKMRALERIWPLTRVRPAAKRGDIATCTVILSSMIAAKSALSFVFGIVMVFWLPLASVIVPSIVAVHDPGDPGLARWVRKVAILQVTSHALAAALGFALAVKGPLNEKSILSVVDANATLLVLASLASLALALAAGKTEATGIVHRGI